MVAGRVGGGHAGEVFAFRGKDASLILSKAAEKDPIATGEKKRSLGAYALEVGSANVIMLLFSVPYVFEWGASSLRYAHDSLIYTQTHADLYACFP